MPDIWLIEDDLGQRIAKAYELGNVPTAAQQNEYEASIRADNANGPRLLHIAGSQATIQIQGVLTGAPNLMAKWFGGGNTTYSEIRDALASADANPQVRDIELFASSPGGEASSEWLATMEAIAATRKPVTARVGTMAASAAYGLVSQADKIVAQNRMSRVGSIGIVATYATDSGVVSITSTDAPNKRPDVNSKEGKAVVTAELDALHEIFADSVATGRKVSTETVNTKFGRGGMMLAADAVKAGMIDSIAGSSHSSGRQSIAAESGTEGVHAMDLKELKEKHPSVYSQAVAEGVAQGTTAERDRVTAHMTMGKSMGAMDIALAAIEAGEAMTATLTAKYLTAPVNERDKQARVTEDAAAAAALAGAKGGDPVASKTKGDDVANAVAVALGLEEGA